jgi:predicted RNA-binding protein
MCEAAAYMVRNGEEELILEAVDVIEPEEDNAFRLVSIFGEQKVVKGRIKSINLVNHRVVFQE